MRRNACREKENAYRERNTHRERNAYREKEKMHYCLPKIAFSYLMLYAKPAEKRGFRISPPFLIPNTSLMPLPQVLFWAIFILSRPSLLSRLAFIFQACVRQKRLIFVYNSLEGGGERLQKGRNGKCLQRRTLEGEERLQ